MLDFSVCDTPHPPPSEAPSPQGEGHVNNHLYSQCGGGKDGQIIPIDFIELAQG